MDELRLLRANTARNRQDVTLAIAYLRHASIRSDNDLRYTESMHETGLNTPLAASLTLPETCLCRPANSVITT
jgi:hypothetical protein